MFLPSLNISDVAACLLQPITRFVWCALVLVLVFAPSIAEGQRATLTDDAQVSASAPNQNFGSRTTVQISGTNLRGFFKFNLAPNLPNGTTGSQIEKATFKLFVNAVTTPGNLDLYSVAGNWDEGTITNNTAPPIGILFGTVAVNATQQDRWITVDLTSVVKDWLDGVQANNGMVLVAALGGVNVTVNSKENQATSHEPILEISLNHVSTADQANSLSGILPVSNGGTGSATQNFVDLSSNQTISGNKSFTGTGNFTDTLRTGSHMRVEGNLFVQNSFPQVNLDNGTGQNLATFNATTGPGSTAAIGSVPGTSFVIRSGGFDSIFIDPNNQRVGIGTTTPAYRLDINGVVNATDFYKNGVPFAAGVWSTSDNDIYYNAGKVGIGTISPSEQLEITNNARIGGTVYSATHNSLPAPTNGNDISIQAGQGGGGYSSNYNANSIFNGGNLQLSAGGAGHAGRGGDITISAGDAFDNGSQGGSILLKAKGYDNWIRGYIGFFTGGGYPFDANIQRERMRIDGNGNVGIGTTSPANLLNLSSGAGAPGIQIDNTDSAKSFSILNVTGSNPRLSLNDVTAGAQRIVIEESGNVGSGTVAPTQKLEVAGKLRIDGDFVATGTKSAVVTLADKSEVALYVVESTANWFEDFGHASITNGVAIVQLDPLFTQIVNTDFAYHVFLTPNGNCNGLFIARKSTNAFEVRELGGGKSNIEFDYRIVARRRGFEKVVSGKR